MDQLGCRDLARIIQMDVLRPGKTGIELRNGWPLSAGQDCKFLKHLLPSGRNYHPRNILNGKGLSISCLYIYMYASLFSPWYRRQTRYRVLCAAFIVSIGQSHMQAQATL